MPNDQQCSGLASKLQGFQSPPSRRNTKNLSLQLTSNDSTSQNYTMNNNPFISTPTTSMNGYFNKEISTPSSPTSVRLYRHPSLSQKDFQTTSSIPSEIGLKRRTTLSLSIPIESEALRYNSSSDSSSSKLSSASILSSNSSNSPVHSYSPSSSNNLHTATSMNNASKQLTKQLSSSSSSNATLKGYTNGDLKTQTLIQNLSNINISDDGDNSKLNSYPDGPKCVYDPYLYLYSEPTLKEIENFDVVINVAKELTPPFLTSSQLTNSLKNITDNILHLTHAISSSEGKNLQYYYVPWTHTSKICNELPFLTNLISASLGKGEKILIHCQCGVSRSASLIVAFLMKLRHLNLNDSYNLLKAQAPDITPNMSLIFQLMEWGEVLGVDSIITTPQYELDMNKLNSLEPQA